MSTRLSEDLKVKIFARLAEESSDTVLANEFDVSRKTIWRMRQKMTAPQKPSEPQTKPSPFPPKRVSARASSLRKDQEKPMQDVTPKVDVVPVKLKTYFAVQKLGGEHYLNVVEAVLDSAHAQGILFRKIQVMDLSSVGGASFVRFRSDLEDALPVLQPLLEKRAVIALEPGTSNFKAVFPTGRTGNFPISTMLMGPKMGYGQVYVGTKIRRWKEQFKR